MSGFVIRRTPLALALAGAGAFAIAAEKTDGNVLADPGVAARGGHEGAAVLWGGRIIDKKTQAEQTCLEVASYPLSARDGRPQTQSRREGQHFLACQAADFDAASYAIGKQATVAGIVGAIEKRVLTSSCSNALGPRGRPDTGSYRRATESGCELSIPLVVVTDSRSWAEPPSRTGAPTM